MKILNNSKLGYCKPCIHNALGVTYARSGNFVEAEKHYSTAFQLDTTLDPLLINLTSLYLQLNRLPESETMANNGYKDILMIQEPIRY
ncbi:MAG: tetratricopeptide repeat protein [Saprospiraceae bacterium]|nr:tetratricopeptide repeat protein [Saprospiraceae bacterium]